MVIINRNARQAGIREFAAPVPSAAAAAAAEAAAAVGGQQQEREGPAAGQDAAEGVMEVDEIS